MTTSPTCTQNGHTKLYDADEPLIRLIPVRGTANADAPQQAHQGDAQAPQSEELNTMVQEIKETIDATAHRWDDKPGFVAALKALLHAKAGAAHDLDAETVYRTHIRGMDFWIDSDGGGGFIHAPSEDDQRGMVSLPPAEMHALMAFWRPLLVSGLLVEIETWKPHVDELVKEAEVDKPDLDMQNTMNWAGDLVNAAVVMDAEQFLTPSAKRLWEQGCELMENPRYSPEVRHADLLILSALIQSPDALQQVAHRMRATLIKADPDLAFHLP